MEPNGQQQSPQDDTDVTAVVELLRVARERDGAPARLHAQVNALVQDRERRPVWRGRGIYAGTLGTAVAAVLAALILIAPGGSPVGPSLADAVALASQQPQGPAPAPDPADNGGRLEANVGDVYFPNWSQTFHWTATGRRSDRLDGRPATTLYYAWTSKTGVKSEIAYTIITGPVLPWPAGAKPITVHGVDMRTVFLDGRWVTTWRRSGNTCVITSTRPVDQDAVPPQVQQLLAASEP